MKFFRMIFAVMALLASGSAAAADIDEMLTDAIGKFKSDIKAAKMDVEKVAVYAIEPDSGGKVNISMVQDQVEAALLETGRFKVINRKALKALLEEQALSLTGVVDETQMVKAGKLIGAQGFFYGSVEVQKNKLVLNIKLIEVESSAVAYSKKFTGESRSFSRIGLYWGYLSTPVGVHYQAIYKNVQGNPNEADKPLTNGTGSGPLSLGVSYKQGFQAVKFVMLGVDMGYASLQSFGSTGKAEFKAVGATTGIETAMIKFSSLDIINARAKIYMSSKEVFGWDYDWLNPYLGISFTSTKLTTFHEAGSADGFGDAKQEHTMVAISPVIGLEVNATDSLSVFGEAVLVLSDVKSDDGARITSVDAAGVTFPEEGFIPKGTMVHFGLKYYFNLF